MACFERARADGVFGVVIGGDALQQGVLAARGVRGARVEGLGTADQHAFDLAAREQAGRFVDELLRHLAADARQAREAWPRTEAARDGLLGSGQRAALGAHHEDGVERLEHAGPGHGAGRACRRFHQVERIAVGRRGVLRLGDLTPAGDDDGRGHAVAQPPVRLAMSASVRMRTGRKRS